MFNFYFLAFEKHYEAIRLFVEMNKRDLIVLIAFLSLCILLSVCINSDKTYMLKKNK